MSGQLSLTDLVNEATLARYQEEYNAVLALANYDNLSGEKTYALLMGTNLYKLREQLETRNLQQFVQDGVADGTLQLSTPTSPCGAPNGAFIAAPAQG